MNDPRPGFMFNIADFWSSESVELMDFEAVGLYLFLLSRQWQAGSLPSDATVLRRLCHGRAEAFDRHWPTVEACFERGEDGRLRNARLERERARADGFSARQSGAAKEKWRQWREEQAKNGVPGANVEPNATAVPRQSHGNAEPLPLTGQGQDKDRTVSPPTPRKRGKRAEARRGPPHASPSIATEPEPGPALSPPPLEVDAVPDTGPAPGTTDPSPGPKATGRGGTELTRWWDAEFQRTRGVPFDWVRTGKKRKGCPDAIVLGNLQGQFELDEIKRRITRYLESPDAFDARTASPRMFAQRYATLAVQVVVPPKAGQATLSYLDELARQPGRKVAQ